MTLGRSSAQARARLWAVVVAWLLVIPFGGVARAADGDLDPTFGTGGKVTTAFPIGSYATAVAIQADGRIVVVGAAAGPSVTGEFAVARYRINGTLDPTFSHDGMLTTKIGVGGDEARSVAIQADGRIVVVGTVGLRKFALARYKPNGALDPTFGGDGIVTTDFTSGQDVAFDVAIQQNGKIVVVGQAGTGGPAAVVRYMAGGSRDRSFSGDGLATIDQFQVVRSVALQADGGIVVAGFDGWGFALARFLRDGGLDPSFGKGGKVRHSYDGGYALAVAVQPDGRIVAGGDDNIFRFGVARYLSDGRLDRTFGGDGRVSTTMGPGEQAVVGLVIQPDGKVVAVGHAGPHEGGDSIVWRFVVARYQPNGWLDDTFGGDGRVATRFDGGAFAAGAAAEPYGRVVAVGSAGDPGTFALARYLT